MKKNFKVEYFPPDECWYCGKIGPISIHHLFRGWQRKRSKTITLCYKCHRRATEDSWFARHLQGLYDQKRKTNN